MGAGIDAFDMLTCRGQPALKRQLVAPFIFLDQMGPAEFVTGQGVDIRPHPHIGLATVTCLFHGRLHHRDSLGAHNEIASDDANLMTAGHGITHSRRAMTRCSCGQYCRPLASTRAADGVLPAMMKNFCPCRRAE